MNLIIEAPLSEPPTEDLSFRRVTQIAAESLRLDCLVEAEDDVKDIYYKYLLRKGLMDFVQDIITPKEHVFGLRLGEVVSEAPAIQLKAIRNDNIVSLLGLIRINCFGF